MKKTKVIVPWDQGLHVRPAAKVINVASGFRSTIQLKAHGKVADARSIINILLLCATLGTLLEVEINGDDEAAAAIAIERLFEMDPEPQSSNG
ncbi:HPr family phosphocarrier protein [Pontiellaceae bacterium B1224]|nr:HPr family phosphocarrier protein [Pontiellaceae bacterium B1224]